MKSKSIHILIPTLKLYLVETIVYRNIQRYLFDKCNSVEILNDLYSKACALKHLTFLQ